jgi:hypothetical protein
MIPNFALSLSFEGIALLRRMGPRWAQIDEVSLDDEEFDSAVIALRDMAERLDPTGAQVALLIPKEQIRFLDQADMGGDDTMREMTIRAALDGATPYAVSDLAFDHLVSGGRLQIAAVAMETLEEARSFAIEHGFEPVCFVAQAPEGAFDGAVFFGKAKGWGRAVARPVRAVEIVPADKAALTPLPAPEIVSHPAKPAVPAASASASASASAAEAGSAGMTSPAAPVDQAPMPKTEPASPPVDTAQVATTPPKTPQTPDDTPAPIAFSTRRTARDSAPTPGKVPSAPAVRDSFKPRFTPVAEKPEAEQIAASDAPIVPKQRPDQDPAVAPDFWPEPEPTAETPPAKAGFFSQPSASALLARAAAAVDAVEGKPASVTPRPKLPAKAKMAAKIPAKTKPQIAKTKSLPPKGQGDVPPPMRKTLPPKLPGKSVPAPGPAIAAARAAGLAAAPVPPPKKDELFAQRPARPVAQQPHEATAPKPRVNPLAKLAALRGSRPTARAVLQPGETTSTDTTAVEGTLFNTPEERDRMTVFGARDRDLSSSAKPRSVGIALSAALLLFLVGVAAWASFFVDEGFARLFRSSEPTATAVASLPPVSTAPIAAPAADTGVVLESAAAAIPTAPTSSARPVARPEAGVQLAAFDTTADVLDDGPAALAVPIITRALTPEEASATYAATGIWQRAPGAPLTPPADGVDDIYAASLDPNIQIFDAVALPNVGDLQPGATLADPGLPPPAGLTFDFDSRDLVRATSEGALTPDGLRIFTGRPPVIPPLRGESASEAPETNAPGSILFRLETMPRKRPEARPDDVLEQQERAQLGGISLAELGRIRPEMRPPTVQEQAEVDAPDATDRAVRNSLVPAGRPRNMAAIVQSVEIRPEPEPEPVQVASVAPRTVAPTLPSSASVTRAATVDNAINLNRINLIGVYGTPDNRRALVRLANGKYEKVKVGDRIDGGRVSAIGEEELRYNKSGRDLVLKMPRG